MPDTEIDGVVVELLEIVIVALAAPDVVGVNVTCSVADWDGVRTVPALMPLVLNAPVAPLIPGDGDVGVAIVRQCGSK